ncbi:MAG: hypothetical protein MK108_12375 [Mariniblastus sp.]|nr:hypothetical protein [Mariniblastus sp.]
MAVTDPGKAGRHFPFSGLEKSLNIVSPYDQSPMEQTYPNGRDVQVHVLNPFIAKGWC